MNKLQQLMKDWEADYQLPNASSYPEINVLIHNSNGLFLIWLAKKANVSPAKIKLTYLLWCYSFKNHLDSATINTLMNQFFKLSEESNYDTHSWLLAQVNNVCNSLDAIGGYDPTHLMEFRKKGKEVAMDILSYEIVEKLLKLMQW